MSIHIGFIGFGEAATALASGLRDAAGVGTIAAYDVLLDSPERGAAVRRRAQSAGVLLVSSVRELVERSDVVFSAVVAASLVDAAGAAAPWLGPRHLYIDINSASPASKRQGQALVEAGGARFVDAAVMAAVPRHGHRVPMLLAGPAAADAVRLLSPLGMNLEVLGDEVGQAAAAKMFRSILIKGLEALLLECVVAAGRLGIDAKVLASATETTPGFDWAHWADYLLCRSAVHGERRVHEMEEVAATLEAMGIEPVMAAAAARRLRWGAERTRDRFPAGPPKTYAEVLAVLAGAGGEQAPVPAHSGV